MEQTIINDKKCFNCGKTFKTSQAAARHQRRKTPCLIRDFAPEDLQNPLRCIYCNKIYVTKGNLHKHLATCKIKNGGMNILDEKVRYEQEIKNLKDQLAQQAGVETQIRDLSAELQEIRQAIGGASGAITNSRVRTTNNTKNITKNNTKNNVKNTNSHDTNNINQTINFYNYNKPKTDTLKLTQDDLLVDNTSKKLLEMIYFNKNIPENHVLWRPNIKERRLLVYKDDTWKTVAGVELAPTFTDVKNIVYFVGHDKINGGELCSSEEEFLAFYPVVREAIARFNAGEPLSNGIVMGVITENRTTVKDTIDGAK
jgi:hypothetical protein